MKRFCFFRMLIYLFFPTLSITEEGSYPFKAIRLPFANDLVQLDDMSKFYLWAKEFQKKDPNVVIAAIGRPTAPIYPPLKKAMALYAHLVDPSMSIEYGDLQGEEEYREKMAKALTRQYNTDFTKENILFTAGGRIGVLATMHLIHDLFPQKKIVTTSPYYPDYKGRYNQPLVLVNTLNSPLTAEKLDKSLQGVDKDSVGAFIFCSPNNPMGWVVSQNEWLKIAKILEAYPDTLILLDEAYAEMSFNGVPTSLVTVAPHLKHRIVLLRSATKGMSASGERMAVAACWNPSYLSKIKQYHASQLIHAPKGAQFSYTKAMESLEPTDIKALADYYEPQVRFLENILKESDFHYTGSTVEGTFYVIANFKEFIGQDIDPGVEPVYPIQKTKIDDDVDIAFHLLAKYGVGFMPLSLFGVDPKAGLVRITCSMTDKERARVSQIIQQMRKDLTG